MRQRIKIRKTITGEILKPEASAKPGGFIYFVPKKDAPKFESKWPVLATQNVNPS